MLKLLASLLKTIWDTSVDLGIETVVRLEDAKLATSSGPLGTVSGV